MDRKDFLTLLATTTASFMIPNSAFASIGGELANPSISVEKQGNTAIVVDASAKQQASVVYLDEDTTLINWSDGTSSTLQTEADGSITLDGTIIGEANVNSNVNPQSVPSGYKHLKRIKTKVSTYDSASNLAALVLSFVPYCGNAVDIANKIRSLAWQKYANAYMMIDQYYHPNTYYIYTVTRLYKNSNYTGLLATYEDGPRKPV